MVRFHRSYGPALRKHANIGASTACLNDKNEIFKAGDDAHVDFLALFQL